MNTPRPSNALLLLLLLLLLGGGVACGEGEDDSPRAVTLSFKALVGAEEAHCGSTYRNLGPSQVQAELADARLFISQLEVRTLSQAWASVTLDDSIWQRQGVALLDFENGTGACADSGTTETNAEVRGVVPAGQYDGVRFRLGVPFELNHVDSANAPAPFNVPGMFWTWQGGYKFVRVDWLVEGGAVARWNVHLGSTGCVSSAPTAAPTNPCSRPNVATIELTSFDLDTDTIALDLAALVSGADLSANVLNTPPGCMSAPNEPQDCGPVFEALGLAFDRGDCVDGCAGQTTFRRSL